MQAKSKHAELAALPSFQQYQMEFSSHIRNPQLNKRPRGVSVRGMKIYNELLYNNLEGFLLACFPVLHRVLGKRKWGRLIRDFFTFHRCHTPLFRQIAEEFVLYLKNARAEQDGDPVFLSELAHYEWIELMLSVSNKEVGRTQIDPDGDLISKKPALNPVLVLQSYAYPVHLIGPRFKPTATPQQETHFAILRDHVDEVKFILLNPLSLRLLVLLQTATLTGEQALLQIAQEMQQSDPAIILAGGKEILRSLREAEVILGVWN